ncbi:DUF4054 domain-containing protein [Pseudomonas sp. NPDC098747]|uniref:DUF4054 domain-containing protein n=1 Tax=Pseudomonas sp. NPDC098747 TaxID=3364487 RepID=UPI00383AAFD9
MIVEFSPAKFRLTFPGAFPEPEYPDLSLHASFNRAAMQIDNTAGSEIPVDPREMILYLATAHIETIGRRDPNMVGQIVSAGQGSTNISISAPVAIGSEAWWLQTSYGQEAWQSTAPYRSFLWVE